MVFLSLVDVLDIFHFFRLGEGKGESEAPGRVRGSVFFFFLLKIPGGGGVFQERGGGGPRGVCGEFCQRFRKGLAGGGWRQTKPEKEPQKFSRNVCPFS